MRRLFVTTVLIVISAVVGFAQSIDVGYAVITPTSGTASNMVVFQTFGFGSNQAGILPQPPTSNAALFVNLSDRFSRDVGVAMVNPNSTSVTATLTIRDENGTQVASPLQVNIAALTQNSRYVREIFQGQPVPREFMGTLTIVASAPIAITVLRFRGVTFSTMPITSVGPGSSVPAIASGVGGPGSVLLAQFAAGLGWASEIIISNTGSGSMTVRVDLFRFDSSPMAVTLNGQRNSSFTGLTIPAGGVIVLRSGDDLFF